MSSNIKFNNFKNFQNQYNRINANINANIAATNPIKDVVTLNNTTVENKVENNQEIKNETVEIKSETLSEPNDEQPVQDNTQAEETKTEANSEKADLEKTEKQDETTTTDASKNLPPSELDNQFTEAKRQNGLIEKLADAIKNTTKIGLGSKKVEAIINDAKQGKISNEQASETIKQYRRSQENIMQAVGDAVSVLVVSLAYFKVKNLYNKKIIGPGKLNSESLKQRVISIGHSSKFEFSPNFIKKRAEKLKTPEGAQQALDKITSKKTMNLIATVPAILLGGFVKKNALKLNRIGTSQYRLNAPKDMDSDEKKVAKKIKKQARRNANFRNNISGMLNGLMMPIVGLLGPAGVPVYLIGNSLNRYFVASREDKGNKSVGNYIRNIKESPLTHVASAGVMAVPMFKNASYSSKLQKNVNIAVEKLRAVTFAEQIQTKTTYEQLEEILLHESSEINSILNNYRLSSQEKITELFENGNIFALKFLQIQDANKGEFGYIARILKEDCPIKMGAIDDNSIAQDMVNKIFGNGKYTIQKYISSGTVAETYAAKDANGNDVVIKLIHEGLSEEKINADAAKFEALIKQSNKTQVEKEYLLKNLEGIKQGILQEMNLENEMKAAKELEAVTKQARLVQSIEAKDGAYVMQKAPGVSLKALNDFVEASVFIESKEDAQAIIDDMADPASSTLKNLIRRFTSQDEQKEYARKYLKLVEDNPGLEKLSPQEANTMIQQLNEVINEQFYRVNPNGNAIHADIHAGNIFIDINKLKEGKSKEIFTLIDTGNVIRLSADQAIRSINLSKYIENGDVDNITAYVMENATLPTGMTKEEAYEKVKKCVQDMFYGIENGKAVRTGNIDNNTLLALTDDLMKELGITPAGDLGNLLKARQSANTSLDEMKELYFKKRIENAASSGEVVGNGVGSVKDMLTAWNSSNQTRKRYEKQNMLKMPLSKRKGFKVSAGTPKENSVERMIYELKQVIEVDPFKGTVLGDDKKFLEFLKFTKKFANDKFSIYSEFSRFGADSQTDEKMRKALENIVGKEAADNVFSNNEAKEKFKKACENFNNKSGSIQDDGSFEKAKKEIIELLYTKHEPTPAPDQHGLGMYERLLNGIGDADEEILSGASRIASDDLDYVLTDIDRLSDNDFTTISTITGIDLSSFNEEDKIIFSQLIKGQMSPMMQKDIAEEIADGLSDVEYMAFLNGTATPQQQMQTALKLIGINENLDTLIDMIKVFI